MSNSLSYWLAHVPACSRSFYARLWLHVVACCLFLPAIPSVAAQADVARSETSSTPAGDTRSEESPPEPEAPGVVNINEANIEELTRLPGVGERRAQAIIALRQRLGRFTKLPQIMRVRGIGRKTFRRLHPMLALEGPTTLKH